MKIIYGSVAALLTTMLVVFAADPKPRSSYAGTWRWSFTMPDGTQVEPKLKLKEVDGKATGTSSFRAGTETPVTNLTVQGDQVAFDVVRERDGHKIITHYSGQLSGETITGKIQSNWNGEGQTYPWEAQRFAGVEGTWKWTNDFGRFRGESRLRLKPEGHRLTGKLTAFRREQDIHGGRFVNEEVSFYTVTEWEGERYTNHFSGTLAGDMIEGKAEINLLGRLRTNDWTAYRAE
jgi:hypothetical protein